MTLLTAGKYINAAEVLWNGSCLSRVTEAIVSFRIELGRKKTTETLSRGLRMDLYASIDLLSKVRSSGSVSCRSKDYYHS